MLHHRASSGSRRMMAVQYRGTQIQLKCGQDGEHSKFFVVCLTPAGLEHQSGLYSRKLDY